MTIHTRTRGASDEQLISDEQLMSRVQAGETEAFGYLYDRHATRAFRVACAVCHDSSRTEEIVQEAFLSMWRGRMGFQATFGSFGSWAMQIVRHRAIDSMRPESSRTTVSELDEEMVDPASRSVAGQVIARDEGDALRTSLRLLPGAQAEVVTLAFFGELSHSEIAEQLSLPAGTVKGRMRLGLEKLRREMEDAE